MPESRAAEPTYRCKQNLYKDQYRDHTVMEDFAQGLFLSILQLPLLVHHASYAQLSIRLQKELQILTCCSQIWLKSSYSHSGFPMLWRFLTKYNFGNCLNIKEIKFTMASHSC